MEEASQVRENMTHTEHVKAACGVVVVVVVVCVCACVYLYLFIKKTGSIYTEKRKKSLDWWDVFRSDCWLKRMMLLTHMLANISAVVAFGGEIHSREQNILKDQVQTD